MILEDTNNDCPICNGNMEYMGDLGNKGWYRCQNCGYEVPLEIDMSDEDEND